MNTLTKKNLNHKYTLKQTNKQTNISWYVCLSLSYRAIIHMFKKNKESYINVIKYIRLSSTSSNIAILYDFF